jgi:hypothetical protein
MKTSSLKPTITKKWHIEVPTHQYLSDPTVFKVWFGKSYLIWKGKSLLQSCQSLAESIERYIRQQKDDDTAYLYHVCNHIKKTRCLMATVEVVENDFIRNIKGAESINGYGLLVAEQKLLDKAHGDPLCLNNNEIAYQSGWITKAHQEKFLKFLNEERKAPKEK